MPPTRLTSPCRSPLRFGTDGWRAVIADEFTFANVARVAQATARFWTQQPPPHTLRRVIVGYDRRFFSKQFATCAAEVMAGNGFETWLTPVPTPTPAVSLAVRTHRAAGGIVITASHNPARFNGFKLKAWFGGSADAALCQGVEAELDREPPRCVPLAEARRAGQVRLRDLRGAHTRALRRWVDFPLIARSRMRLAHDALFGVGAGCFEALLAGTTCRVTTLNGAHDVNFGGLNPEPVPQNYGPTSAFLRRHPHDLCLVTDGDADRLGGLDGRGNPVTTHRLICLLLEHLVRHRQARGRVVKALSTTSMVNRICAAHGLECVETGVGFKYLSAEMAKGGVLVGVEESGGVGLPAHLPERDGLLAGLLLLELLATERQSLPRLIARLERRFGPHRYARFDAPFPLDRRAALLARCAADPPARLGRAPVIRVDTFDGVKFTAADGAWLMLRGSGTEPVLRIYAEAASDTAAHRLLALGRRLTLRFPGPRTGFAAHRAHKRMRNPTSAALKTPPQH